MTIFDVCVWLENTRLATAIVESPYGFPIVVGTHILALTLSVGLLLWVDLRMAGLALRGMRVTQVYRRLAPWFLFGFTVMAASGVALFTAYATRAYANDFFRIKMAALLLAALNALLFHYVTQKSSAQWDISAKPPLRVRAAGYVSLALWAIVILAGRMMSYTMFSFPASP